MMRLRFSYGLPVLRRDFRLRRILAVRIWLCLLLFYRMCNRIQGRTPVFLRGPLGIVMTHQMLFLRWFICVPMVWGWVWLGLRIHQTSVSEMDPVVWFVGWDPSDFWFWNGSLKCSWLTLKWIIVVVRTFSCWSDFNMRASVKHELLGHGFHDELFN